MITRPAARACSIGIAGFSLVATGSLVACLELGNSRGVQVQELHREIGPLEREISPLEREIGPLERELDLARIELDRLREVVRYSTRYRITADLAALIWDVAAGEGLDPALAFAIVRTESNFNARAVSHAGAVGLAQLMPRTAASLKAGITHRELFDPRTNVTLGLRYLRLLLCATDGDTTEALLRYNGCVRALGCRSYPDIVLAAAAEMRRDSPATPGARSAGNAGCHELQRRSE